jgi:hypothetical protein
MNEQIEILGMKEFNKGNLIITASEKVSRKPRDDILDNIKF